MEANLQISLPQALKEWLDRQVVTKGFHTPSELVEDLLLKEQAREAFTRLEDHLEKVMDGEEAGPMTREDWDNVRKEGRRRIEELRKS